MNIERSEAEITGVFKRTMLFGVTITTNHKKDENNDFRIIIFSGEYSNGSE